MGRGFDFVKAKESSFALIEFRVLPGFSAEVPRVVPGGVVIAPVGGVLDCASTGDGGFEARCLGDEPVGHVSAIAVTTDGKVVRISIAVFDEGIYAGEDVTAGFGDEVGSDLEREVVAVAG